jgi:ABC-type nickel/cobalt efflux system permease component RcnA
MLWRRQFLGLALSCFVLCVSAPLREASSHPVPKDNHDRTIVVSVTPPAVVVEYRLEVDEARAALDMREVGFEGITTPDEFRAAFTKYIAPILASNLVARLDSEALKFTCTDRKHQVLDHLRCDFRFEARWQLMPGSKHSFTFREGNYDLDDFSRLAVSLQGTSGVQLEGVTAPSTALQELPPMDRGPKDMEKLRRLAATVCVADLPAEHPQAPVSSPPKTEPPPAPPAAPPEEDSLWRLLLDTQRGFAMLLLIAAGLGAAHALTPGHGKTMVAAYLVGERGTVWHAIVLGVITTVAHTGAVLAFAALGLFIPEGALQEAMQVIQLLLGVSILLLGLWLLQRRLLGRADHVHIGGHGHGHDHGHSHDHGHGHDHSHPEEPPMPDGRKVGWWHLLILGLQGGLVPCWDAIVLLSLAVASGRFWIALPLLLAFSGGLAAVLIGIGIGVVCARNWAGARFGKHPRLQRLVRLLPILSAVTIIAMGLWLCYDGVNIHAPNGR